MSGSEKFSEKSKGRRAHTEKKVVNFKVLNSVSRKDDSQPELIDLQFDLSTTDVKNRPSRYQRDVKNRANNANKSKSAALSGHNQEKDFSMETQSLGIYLDLVNSRVEKKLQEVASDWPSGTKAETEMHQSAEIYGRSQTVDNPPTASPRDRILKISTSPSLSALLSDEHNIADHIEADENSIEFIPGEFASFLRSNEISMIVCNVDVAERFFFQDIELGPVMRIYLELHDHITGLKGVTKIFSALGRLGFAYDPRHSNKSLVLFRRVEDDEVLRPYDG